MPAGFIKQNQLQASFNASRCPSAQVGSYIGTAATRFTRPDMENNWRKPRQPAEQYFSTTVTDTLASTAHTSVPIERFPRTTTSADYSFGDIVTIAHLVPALNPNESNPKLKVTTHIGPVCPKVRKAIVVRVHQERMFVLPLYSSNGRGLETKPDAYKLTSIFVTNRADMKPGALKMRKLESLFTEKTYMPRVGSHVNLLDVVSLTYNWPIHRFSRLCEESIALLKQRYKLSCDMGLIPIQSQTAFFQKGVASTIERRPSTARRESCKPRGYLAVSAINTKQSCSVIAGAK